MDLKTGDLLLIRSHSKKTFWKLFEYAINLGTSSSYTHCGIIIHNPKTSMGLDIPDGYYLWESGYEGVPDEEDNQIKCGVQLTKIEQVLKSTPGKYFIRRWDISNDTYKEILNRDSLKIAHNCVHNTPYDMNVLHWVKGVTGLHINKTKDHFWCSAFVGFIYSILTLAKTENWTELSPEDLSSYHTSDKIHFLHGLSDDTEIDLSKCL